ncbi:unnamed protein product [Clonostachys chloroleuca]|uniref:Amidohydrolase-related domain-containing protein n=1 Tax=Clonostachys chloroleuca TaxID=1926264 RepID=A0AA35PYJ7_9HYPO|nr:unnamed protein product [Clonostachys chloroleuca]
MFPHHAVSKCFALFLMVYYSIAQSTLLNGGTIISFEEGENSLQVIRDGSLLITQDRITGIYRAGETPDSSLNYSIVDVTGRIITPGFIDTHRHGWQTGLKTLGSNTSLWEYYDRYSEYAAGSSYAIEDVYIGQLAGLLEALNAGVTTTLDHAHHTWSNDTSKAGIQASIDSWARVFWSYAFHDLPDFTVSEQFANFRDIAETGTFKNTATTLGIACDFFGPDPTLENVQRVVELALEFNVSVVTTHTVEGPFGARNGPLDVHSAGLLNTTIPVVFSHASFLTYQDHQLLQLTNQYISITPESEMHYGHTHPNNHLAMDQAALGVDTHFTFSSDILTQARIWLQKARYTMYDWALKAWRVPANNPMSANQAFLLATRKGGLALRRPDLGVISEGAKADIIVWDGTSPSLLGWNDPVAAIMLHANVGDIEHVLVDGKFIKKDGKITNPDHPSIRERFLKHAKRIQDTFLAIPKPVPAKAEHFRGGGAELMVIPQLDVTRGDGNGYGTAFLQFSGTQ